MLSASLKSPYDSSRHACGGIFSLSLTCKPEKGLNSWSIFANTEFTILHPNDPNKNFVKSKF